MDAPKPYVDSGALTILSGAMNILIGGLLFLTLIWVCIGVFWLVPMAVGVFQIVVGLAMSKGRPHPAAKHIGLIGIIASGLNFNPLGLGAAVITMLNTKKPEVAGYLSGV